VNSDVSRSIVDYLHTRLPAYLEELRQLCAIDSRTGYRVGIGEMDAWIRSWIDGRGWSVETVPDPAAGDSLLITATGTTGHGRVFLAAHMDTVYPVGVAAERPLHEDGDRLLGPGTADNKSGLLSGLYAMAALQDLDLLRTIGAVTLLCGSDEEAPGMPVSGRICDQQASHYDAGLVLECAGEHGEIVSCRKGMGTFILRAYGRAAHAGVEPERGANAIMALGRQLDHVGRLDGFRPGVSVNVTTIEGGTAGNVIPAEASATIDVRVEQGEDMEPVEDALRGITLIADVPNTRTELQGGWHAPPMTLSGANRTLADEAIECARQLGFAVADVKRGGVSYANRLAAHGLGVLDGLGPIGGNDHSPDEYIVKSSIVPRTALLTLLITRCAVPRAGG